MPNKSGLAVIIVNYQTPYYAIKCVRSLVQERGSVPDLEVILVDNASGDGSPVIMTEQLADLIEMGFVTLLPLDLNGGFGWANNQAMLMLLARTAPPDYIMLLNPDCTVERHAISNLRNELSFYDNCAVAGSQLLNPDGSWTGSAFRFPSIGRELVRGSGIAMIGRFLRIAPTVITSDEPCEAEWVTGASCLFRTSTLIENGLFDDGFFLYFEEVELMFRLRKAGWTIRHVPSSRVFHIGGAATGLREGKALLAPSFPLYWFQSRRRFLALAYGTLGAWMASMAWIIGVFIRRAVSVFQRSRADVTNLADVRQILSCGLYPNVTDRTPAIVRKGDPAGRPPYWMGTETQTSHAD